MGLTDDEYARLINVARIDLESSGNPAYGVVVVRGGQISMAPMVFATLKPAVEHAARLREELEQGDEIFLIGRGVDGERVAFSVLDERAHRLHGRLEVLERSFAEDEDTQMM